MSIGAGHPDLRGTWFVVPTAFHDDGELDAAGVRRVAEAAVSWGADGLTAMGVTSEAAALIPSERTAALTALFEGAGGRVPVVVGCSGPSVHVAAHLARQAADLGAVAAMVSAPPLHRDADRLPGFFGKVAEAGGLPVVVQDEPAATGVRMAVGTLVRCLEASGSRTVKLEDPPTPPKIARLLDADPELRVFGGLGGVAALWELRRGACGTMTGFAFPEILRAIRVALGSGDAARAARIFDRCLPLIQMEAQPGVGLAIRKELLRRRGALFSAATRVGTPLDRTTAAEIDDVLERVGIDPAMRQLDPVPGG